MEDNRNQFNDPYDTRNESKEYGLPDVNFEPIDRDEVPDPVARPVKRTVHKKEEKKKSNIVPVLVGAFVIVLIFGVALYYFVLREPEPVQQAYVPYEAEVPEVIEEPVENYEEFTPVEAYEAPVEPKAGSLTIINGRTQRNYIVVGSFFDEDNAHDYGNLLASRGVDAKIIQPGSRGRFYKLAVADFDTFDNAADQISTFKETYGEQIWVLKY